MYTICGWLKNTAFVNVFRTHFVKEGGQFFSGETFVYTIGGGFKDT